MAKHTIHADDAGQRLDRYLRKLLPKATLGHIFKLIRTGRVKVGGERAKAAHRLVPGELVEIDADGATLQSLRRRQGSKRKGAGARQRGVQIHTLYEDEHVLAVIKPRGLPVHGGSGQLDSLVERLTSMIPSSGAKTFRPSPAHRLDRETSGVLLVGRSAAGLRGLHEAFREGSVRKRYLAITRGVPRRNHGVIDKALVRRDDARGAKMRIADQPDDPEAQSAQTQFRVLASKSGHALMSVELLTGRTHQIRAHLASIRAPLIGDVRYGGGRLEAAPSPGFWLHAGRLDLAHPVTGERLRFRCVPPEDFQEVAAHLELPLPG